MHIIRSVALLAAGSIIGAGCGQSSTPTPMMLPAAIDSPAAPAIDGSCPPDRVGSRTVLNDPVLICTGTSTGPRWMLSIVTTTTTTCRATVPPGSLEAAQAELDSLITGRRAAESAVAQIQLTVDNTGRQVDIAKRYLAEVQADYNQAQAAFEILGTDTAKDKFDYQARRLADAKDVVASWEALRKTASGDLSRGKATLGDWDKRISEARQAVAADKAAENTLTCS